MGNNLPSKRKNCIDPSKVGLVSGIIKKTDQEEKLGADLGGLK